MDFVSEVLNNAFSFYEQLNLSVTGLLVIAGVFFIAFLIAVRESVAWFFKIDDVKRDVRKLHDATTNLEAEIKVLQNMILQAKSNLKSIETQATGPQTIAPVTTAPLAETIEATNGATLNSDQNAEEKRKATRFGGFPIVH